MNAAPINIFQKLMRKWDAVHPYNAAQAMKLIGEPDHDALQTSWQAALKATGLVSLVINEKDYTFNPTPGRRPATNGFIPARHVRQSHFAGSQSLLRRTF